MASCSLSSLLYAAPGRAPSSSSAPVAFPAIAPSPAALTAAPVAAATFEGIPSRTEVDTAVLDYVRALDASKSATALGKLPLSPRPIASAEYNKMVQFLERPTKDQFDTSERARIRAHYRLAKNSAVTVDPKVPSLIRVLLSTRQLPKGSAAKPVARREDFFDIITAYHCVGGQHLGRGKTMVRIHEMWSEIPKWAVNLYLQNCPTCRSRAKGPKTPTAMKALARRTSKKSNLPAVVAVPPTTPPRKSKRALDTDIADAPLESPSKKPKGKQAASASSTGLNWTPPPPPPSSTVSAPASLLRGLALATPSTPSRKRSLDGDAQDAHALLETPTKRRKSDTPDSQDSSPSSTGSYSHFNPLPSSPLGPAPGPVHFSTSAAAGQFSTVANVYMPPPALLPTLSAVRTKKHSPATALGSPIQIDSPIPSDGSGFVSSSPSFYGSEIDDFEFASCGLTRPSSVFARATLPTSPAAAPPVPHNTPAAAPAMYRSPSAESSTWASTASLSPSPVPSSPVPPAWRGIVTPPTEFLAPHCETWVAQVAESAAYDSLHSPPGAGGPYGDALSHAPSAMCISPHAVSPSPGTYAHGPAGALPWISSAAGAWAEDEKLASGARMGRRHSA
ncbi:hypothetical protein JCM10450v2_001165 [Rhodotorula kratochvilovae]